ncbi:hypothetical protein ACT4VL_01885 [Acinetobacter baumannii]
MRFVEKDSGLKGMVGSIYFTDGKYHYLSMIENYIGLRVFFENEIDITSNDSGELCEFKAALYNDIRQMHPVLYNILKEDWDLYIDIVEGVPESWQIFLEKLKEFDGERCI